MKSTITTFVAFGLIIVVLVNNSWHVSSEAAAPDSRATAFVLHSNSDQLGLMPYGYHVVLLRDRRPKRSDMFDPIFAGTCDSEQFDPAPEVAWPAANKLLIKCRVRSETVLRKRGSWEGVEVLYENVGGVNRERSPP
jgi:hypothetical protein